MKKYISILILSFIGLISLAQSNLCPKMKNPIKAEQYTIEYDTANKIPILVYYVVKHDQSEIFSRSQFHIEFVDNSAPSYWYTGSGYDRGHMCPFNATRTHLEGYQSFDMINIIPQTPSLNRGIWRMIESFEEDNDSLYCYVVTGPILDGSRNYINNKILIPNKFFKVIYNPFKNQMIGFIVSQNSTGDIKSYITTVDKIESILHIDLFYQLDTRLQNKLESRVNKSKWRF